MIHFVDRAFDHQELLDRAKTLPTVGVFKVHPDGYAFLKVDDRFIFDLLPFLKEKKARKPDYFDRSNACGAHVSVAYPDEAAALMNKECGKNYIFSIDGFYCTSFEKKKYYILYLGAPELEQIRLSFGLDRTPRYKGFTLPFHITVAVG